MFMIFNKDTMGGTVLVMSTLCTDGKSKVVLKFSWPELGIASQFQTGAEKGP